MKPLTAREVEGYLKEYGYVHDHTTGSHRYRDTLHCLHKI